MKKIYMFFVIATLIVASTATAGAANKKKRTVRQAKPKVYMLKTGTLLDGSTMHCLRLAVIDINNDTIDVFISDKTNTKNANLLEGNIINARCYKTANGYVATKVEGCNDYAIAIGRWTKPDPIDPSKRMGVELMVNCKAQSINMATLPYERWEITGLPGKLIIVGKSIGNGQTLYAQTEVTIRKKDGKWMMTDDVSKDVYTKEN